MLKGVLSDPVFGKRPVAVKMLNNDHKPGTSPATLELELRTQDSLQHKNIVRVINYCHLVDKRKPEGGKSLCIIMELLDESLYDRVNALSYQWGPW